MPAMRAMLDNMTGRAVVLGLTLHAEACAHVPAAPTAAPRISIAVAPIGFGPDNGLTLEKQAECEFGKELFEELYSEVGQSFELHGIAELRRIPGLLLVMRFARVEGHSMMSGIKRIVLEGRLLKDGQVVAGFTALRDTTQGAFGNDGRGFQTTCGIMEDLAEELAEDVGAWLYQPTMNANLGDAGP